MVKIDYFELKIAGLTSFLAFIFTFALQAPQTYGVIFAVINALLVSFITGLSVMFSIQFLQHHEGVIYMPIRKLTAERLNGGKQE